MTLTRQRPELSFAQSRNRTLEVAQSSPSRITFESSLEVVRTQGLNANIPFFLNLFIFRDRNEGFEGLVGGSGRTGACA